MHRRPLRVAEADLNMTEAQLFARWIRACQELNLRYFHVYSGMMGQFGYPDLTIAGPGGVWFVELKSINGT